MAYLEESVAADTLRDGEMKQVTVGDHEVLLARVNGAYFAVHAHCTHYGAPLADGALDGDRVICPWHHACFSVRTGDHLEPPGLDALPRYSVRVDNGQVIVRVPDDAGDRRVPEMAAPGGETDEPPIVIVGDGAAGAYAAEAVRQAGYTGRVVLVGDAEELPVDRPNCSKDYLQGNAPEEWMTLRGADFYDTHGIERRTGRRVTKADTESKTLTFSDGGTLEYQTLVLCPGGTPRTLDLDGAGLDGVHLLRSFPDSKALRAAAENAEKAVVIGASFIGMEVAWSLREQDCEVTVVAPEEVPFARVLGERVGRFVQALHEDGGVRFALGMKTDKLIGNGRIERVVLDDGTELDADLVVIGIGVRPATDFVEGLKLNDDGGIPVDARLQAADGVYAAGDVAAFPYGPSGERVRIEHWRLAAQHGRIAGTNAAGGDARYTSIPCFWTAQFGTNFRYVGHASDWDDVIYDGDVASGEFIAYYVQNGRVQAACGVGRDREMAALEALMRRDAVPTPTDLRSGNVDLPAALRALAVSRPR